jgi:hypothetical protein
MIPDDPGTIKTCKLNSTNRPPRICVHTKLQQELPSVADTGSKTRSAGDKRALGNKSSGPASEPRRIETIAPGKLGLMSEWL